MLLHKMPQFKEEGNERHLVIHSRPTITSAKETKNRSFSIQPPEEYSTVNVNDLVDWIPIENNADEFDLGQILQEVEANTTSTTTPDPALALMEKKIPTTTSVSSSQNTLVQNFTSNREMQQYPFFPKMYFPNSNVTINYNFNK